MDITHLSSRSPTSGLPVKLDQLFSEKRLVQVSGIDSKGIHQMKNTHSRNLVKSDKNSCKNLCFLPQTRPPAPPSSVGHGVQAGAQKQTPAFPSCPICLVPRLSSVWVQARGGVPFFLPDPTMGQTLRDPDHPAFICGVRVSNQQR